jgi:hypothetical protein
LSLRPRTATALSHQIGGNQQMGASTERLARRQAEESGETRTIWNWSEVNLVSSDTAAISEVATHLGKGERIQITGIDVRSSGPGISTLALLLHGRLTE